MNRSYPLALLAFLLILLGLLTLQAGIAALALPLLVYLLAGFWRAPETVELQATRAMSAERILTGDEVGVTLTVTNRGAALEEVWVEDQLPAGLEVADGQARHVCALAAGASASWSYRLRGKRGYFGLKHVRIRVLDSLGLVRLESSLDTDGQLFILPPVLRLGRVAIQPRRTRVFSGSIPARQGGSGVEFFDVRDYQQGDSPRWINWRITARQQQAVFTNQFEQERAADVGLILDGRHRTNDFGECSLFEHSILAIAALSDSFLNSGNRVGLLFYGKQVHWTLPGYGRIQSERILHDLSRLEAGDSLNFNELYIPRHVFPSHSQLVLVSPLVSDDFETLAALRARGYPLLVISPDPVAFEMAALPETSIFRQAHRIVRMQRLLLLQRLRGTGIQVVDWDVSVPFEQVARRELDRRQVRSRGVLE